MIFSACFINKSLTLSFYVLATARYQIPVLKWVQAGVRDRRPFTQNHAEAEFMPLTTLAKHKSLLLPSVIPKNASIHSEN